MLYEHEVEVPADLPRIGVTFTLAPGLERLEYLGRGPWENYPDRQASAVVGRYASTVSDEYVPYIAPQEHGHHGDVRWLRAHSRGRHRHRGPRHADDRLLREPLHGAGPDRRAPHRPTCEPRPEVILNLDHAQRGLGTASCGPDTSPRYRLSAGTYRFSYVIQQLGL